MAQGAATPALCAAQDTTGRADTGRASGLTAFLPRLLQTRAGMSWLDAPGDRDHRSTSLGERTRDPTPQAPARANDDRGPARQITHNRPLPCVPMVSLAVVLVVAADPELERIALIAAL